MHFLLRNLQAPQGLPELPLPLPLPLPVFMLEVEEVEKGREEEEEGWSGVRKNLGRIGLVGLGRFNEGI